VRAGPRRARAARTLTVVGLPERLRTESSAPNAPSRPPEEETGAAFKERVQSYEIDLIVDALQRAGGNQTAAAKLLDMSLRTLVHKIKSYGIKKRFDAQ